jgi:hypothetical protein
LSLGRRGWFLNLKKVTQPGEQEDRNQLESTDRIPNCFEITLSAYHLDQSNRRPAGSARRAWFMDRATDHLRHKEALG